MTNELIDDRYHEAVQVVIASGIASISGLQRRMRIGYNHAARLVEAMELDGVVSTPDYTGHRKVLHND